MGWPASIQMANTWEMAPDGTRLLNSIAQGGLAAITTKKTEMVAYY